MHGDAFSEMSLEMTIFLCYCLSLCNVLTAVPRSHQTTHSLEEGNDDAHAYFSSTCRVQRAMQDILTTILKTAWIKYSSKDYIQYEKIGTYKDARRDFRKLNPTDVTHEGPFLRGKIGDTVLQLHNAVRRGQKNKQGADIRIYFKGDDEKVEKLSIQYVPKH